ncbi:MAG: tripartite tricarboxylate transporter substrate binding protein [Alphaproteobacteria bacterium]|nr:tripartite tricarboxylate transporter substrate binding protein [Alphaproteobacteria bacterium]
MRAAALAFAFALLAFAPPAQAQSARTIKVIVPSTAGGGADTLARLLGDQVARKQGQTVVIENRPGAGNTIGTEFVARAAPDGNTVLVTTPEFVINAHLRKLNYDPLTSFEPICYLVKSPQLIVVHPSSPYRTLTDFLNAARAKPGELTIASAGPASSPHIAIEAIKHASGADISFVPYQGSTPAVNALLGGHITAAMASYPNLAELMTSGKLRAIATASATRIAPMSDVPTVAESGFKDFEADIWFGLVAPAKTPGDVLTQLAEWFTAALKDPEVAPKLAAQGLFPVGACGTALSAFTTKQYQDYGRAIRDAGIKAQ